jgi:hypothetical protein
VRAHHPHQLCDTFKAEIVLCPFHPAPKYVSVAEAFKGQAVFTVVDVADSTFSARFKNSQQEVQVYRSGELVSSRQFSTEEGLFAFIDSLFSPTGKPCTHHFECRSKVCESGTCANNDAANLPSGAACDSDYPSMCASARCVEDPDGRFACAEEGTDIGEFWGWGLGTAFFLSFFTFSVFSFFGLMSLATKLANFADVFDGFDQVVFGMLSLAIFY